MSTAASRVCRRRSGTARSVTTRDTVDVGVGDVFCDAHPRREVPQPQRVVLGTGEEAAAVGQHHHRRPSRGEILTLPHSFQSLPIELDTVSRPLRRRREPIRQIQRMRQEALEPEAVDLEIRTVGQRSQ